MFVYIGNSFRTIAMSNFTFILHVPDRFYGFCRLRTLHISRPQIKPHLNRSRTKKLKNCTQATAFIHDFTVWFCKVECQLAMLCDVPCPCQVKIGSVECRLFSFFFCFCVPDRLHRQPKHLLAFICAELGTRYVNYIILF